MNIFCINYLTLQIYEESQSFQYLYEELLGQVFIPNKGIIRTLTQKIASDYFYTIKAAGFRSLYS